MKISVVGAGNGGCAVAGDMASRGLDVTLIKTSNSIHDDNFNYLKENGGIVTLNDFGDNGCMNPTDDNKIIKKGKLSLVTRDLSVLRDMDLIIIYVQTNYHEELIKRMAPYIKDDQILVINPGYFSTAYVLKYCKDKDITVVEAQSSFIDCRIQEPGTIKVGFRNVRNPLGVYPIKNITKVKPVLDSLGFPFYYLDNVAEAALHNPNLIVHTIGSVLNMAMIDTEKENFCMYHSSFTEHVWNVLEQLDNEKMDILEKLGCERIQYVEECKFRNSLDDKEDAKKVFFDYASMPTRAKAPSKVDSRYITEDVPQGLVMLEALGKCLDVKTPVASALISIASAALNIDFRTNGRTVERLGYDNIMTIINDSKCNIIKR